MALICILAASSRQYKSIAGDIYCGVNMKKENILSFYN